MTIDASGWLDWPEKRPGPAFKVYDVVNLGAGIVWHSMEGWYDWSVNGELDNPNRQASWMFSIRLDGSLVQHYPISASCWASGNGLANTHWWSVELEGLLSMPINAEQMMTAEALIAEWAEWSGKVPSRAGQPLGGIFGDGLKTMLEHREVDTIVADNGGETACPSERYQPLWAALEEDVMTPAEKAAFDALVARVDAHDHRFDRIEADDTSVVEDAWLGPALAEIRHKHEALNATVTPLVRDVAALTALHQPHEHAGRQP